jgi:hypothetical protein
MTFDMESTEGAKTGLTKSKKQAEDQPLIYPNDKPG